MLGDHEQRGSPRPRSVRRTQARPGSRSSVWALQCPAGTKCSLRGEPRPGRLQRGQSYFGLRSCGESRRHDRIDGGGVRLRRSIQRQMGPDSGKKGAAARSTWRSQPAVRAKLLKSVGNLLAYRRKGILVQHPRDLLRVGPAQEKSRSCQIRIPPRPLAELGQQLHFLRRHPARQLFEIYRCDRQGLGSGGIFGSSQHEWRARSKFLRASHSISCAAPVPDASSQPNGELHISRPLIHRNLRKCLRWPAASSGHNTPQARGRARHADVAGASGCETHIQGKLHTPAEPTAGSARPA
jgi:hypothetical protein